ncbi:TPA: endonuclease/exonuclease/phosphatase family protein [Vibrio vulnificus]|nr:endonuclease/exonuclease/phosphatase family protein [Vibrio vulnificus]
MRTRIWVGLPLALVLGGIFAFHTVFHIPEQPEMTTISDGSFNQQLHCYESSTRASIDQEGRLNLLVWNIYKQNRANWQSVLTQMSAGAQLILLQEASLEDGLKRWIASGGWSGEQVNAFKAFDKAAGVLTLGWRKPRLACGYTQLEPWIRLPKSGLYSEYPLSDGQMLIVVNLHAVNFTWGVQEYQQQVNDLIAALKEHPGPAIVAGDFNTWSEKRLQAVTERLENAGLIEVVFSPDQRTRFITGLPLDHVFYKGLVLQKAEAPQTDASDHNPLLVSFTLPTDK